jgi:hypothetical protein
MAKNAPGGAVLLDRISEFCERDLGRAHQVQFAVDGLVAQESADLVGSERGRTSFTVARQGLMLLIPARQARLRM